jgi:S1-C subfamily serine protease
MEQLELINRATREGWRETPRFYGEFQDHLQSLRTELGEELYDLLLYAAGETNRVIVTDILKSSPAEESGIEGGDVILSYNDRRMFNTHELQGAIAEGERGEPVGIDLLRNGQPMRILIPRGPLGIRTRADRRPP